MGSPSTRACLVQWTLIDKTAIKRLAKGRRTPNLIAVQSRDLMVAHPGSGTALKFPSELDVMRPQCGLPSMAEGKAELSRRQAACRGAASCRTERAGNRIRADPERLTFGRQAFGHPRERFAVAQPPPNPLAQKLHVAERKSAAPADESSSADIYMAT